MTIFDGNQSNSVDGDWADAATALSTWKQQTGYVPSLYNFNTAAFWNPNRPNAYSYSFVFSGGGRADLDGLHGRVGSTWNRDILVGANPRLMTAQFGGLLDYDIQGQPESGTGDWGFDWFERIHVDPLTLDFGNVTSDITTALSLYNAYRQEARSLISFVNNAGAGIEITDLPTLPSNIPSQTSLGLTLLVTTSGPPTIEGTLDFIFDVVSASVTVSGNRIILFPYVPQNITKERLEWLTQIIVSADGSEQRTSLRQYPRKKVEMEFIHVNESERRKFNSFMFGWQSKVFGVPMWWDARRIGVDVAASSSSAEISNLDYADYQVGNLVMFFRVDPVTREITSEAQEIASITYLGDSPNAFGTTGYGITLTSPLSNAYPADQSIVVPVLPCITGEMVNTQSFPAGYQESKIQFQSLNSFTSVTESAAAFNTALSKVLLDDQSFQDGMLVEDFMQRVTRIDGDTGEVLQLSEELGAKRNSVKKWVITDAQKEWEVRQLLYYLRGRQVSFLLPSYRADMVANGNASAGGNTINIENIGYSSFINGALPYNRIRVVFKSPGVLSAASPQVLVTEFSTTVTGGTEIDATTETITVGTAWPANFTPADVERIEYLALTRFESDSIEIVHNWTDMVGLAKDTEITAVTRTLLNDG